jgi:hypothetical protein
MATTTYSTDGAGYGTSPMTKVNGGVIGGRLRRYRASVTFASQASGDTVVLFKVPAGSVFAFGMVNASATFGATATIAVGISGTTGKYRTAATHTTTVPTLFGLYTAADDSATTAEEEILLTIAAAALPASGSAVIDMYFSAP